MDPHGLTPYSCPEANMDKRESHILRRSQEQKGKKRKNDKEEHEKECKKRKEELEQDLNNLSQLYNTIENQENLTDELLFQLMLGSEELELLKEKSSVLSPHSSYWDVRMSETKTPFDIISLLKDRSKMVDRRIRLLCEMMLF